MKSPFILVSDLDDTLKISHSTNHFRTVLRGLFTHEAYAGMAELYTEMLGADSTFMLLSSSPRLIRPRIEKFLKKHGFPKAKIQLRDWVRQPKIHDYKTEALRKIAIESTLPFILIGDDTEWDPEVFKSLVELCPERIQKIYIRRMRGRPLPEGMEPFHTAYEIALSEMAAGRLDARQVEKVGQAVLAAANPDLVIPWFAVCPERTLVHPAVPELRDLHTRILDKISLIARRR